MALYYHLLCHYNIAYKKEENTQKNTKQLLINKHINLCRQ